jgi:hypothetical protein
MSAPPGVPVSPVFHEPFKGALLVYHRLDKEGPVSALGVVVDLLGLMAAGPLAFFVEHLARL